MNEAHKKAKFMFSSVVCGKLSRVLTIKLNSWYKATQRDFQAAGDKFVKVAVKYLDFDNFTSNISNVTGRALVPALLLGLYFSSAQDGGASQVGNFAMALLYMQELIAVIKYMVQGGKFYQSYQVSCDMMDQLLEMPKEQCGESVLRKVHTVELQNVTSPYATICFMAVKKRKNLRTNWAGMRCWILWRPRRMGMRPRSTARATT